MIKNTLLFGLLWGLTEAILGTALHILPLGQISGWLLYPIGFYCLFKLFQRTQSVSAVLSCGLLTAFFKLSSLLFYTPVLLMYTLKPTFFILAETCFTAVVLYVACFAQNRMRQIPA